MRLFELIKHTTTTDTRDLTKGERLNPKAFKLVKDDPGTFSFVVPDEDPHMVRKYSRDAVRSLENGFAKYAAFIAEHELWDVNVHFPRVYNTNEHTDDEGNIVYDWTVEKLLDWHEISMKEYEFMYNRYFGIALLSKTPDLAIRGMADLIKRSLRYDASIDDNVRDPYLISAMEVLKVIKAHFGFIHYDIHRENIMFRRTSIGLQLVFNDPFGFAP